MSKFIWNYFVKLHRWAQRTSELNKKFLNKSVTNFLKNRKVPTTLPSPRRVSFCEQQHQFRFLFSFVVADSEHHVASRWNRFELENCSRCLWKMNEFDLRVSLHLDSEGVWLDDWFLELKGLVRLARTLISAKTFFIFLLLLITPWRNRCTNSIQSCLLPEKVDISLPCRVKQSFEATLDKFWLIAEVSSDDVVEICHCLHLFSGNLRNKTCPRAWLCLCWCSILLQFYLL